MSAGRAAALLLAAQGLARADAALYLLRLAAGVASAVSFVSGGALAAPPLPWPGAWLLPGALALGATGITAAGTRVLLQAPLASPPRTRLALRPFAWGLAAYAMFGLGFGHRGLHHHLRLRTDRRPQPGGRGGRRRAGC